MLGSDMYTRPGTFALIVVSTDMSYALFIHMINMEKAASERNTVCINIPALIFEHLALLAYRHSSGRVGTPMIGNARSM